MRFLLRLFFNCTVHFQIGLQMKSALQNKCVIIIQTKWSGTAGQSCKFCGFIWMLVIGREGEVVVGGKTSTNAPVKC